MNERIRELWAKCVIKHTKDPMNWQTVADEFAELIIKQCAKSLWTEECHNSDLALEEFERNSAKIKEHFGVGK